MSGTLSSPSASALEEVKLAFEKAAREIGSLQGEVNELTNLIAKFKGGRNLRKFIFASNLDWRRGERESTPEPKSPIQEALWLAQSANTVEEIALLLKAVSRGLDGALRDIRSAKLDLLSISDDGDLRDEFRAWKDSQP